MPYQDCVTIWVVKGADFHEQAVISSRSVHRQMPDIQRVLITPDVAGVHVNEYDTVIQVEEANTGYWFLDSLYYLEAGTRRAKFPRRVMFLDADTYICEPVYELFDMLGHVLFMGAHAPGRFTTGNVNNLTPAFPEINVGVLLFYMQNNHFILEWRDQYERHKDIYKNNDQGSLRDYLWQGLEEIRSHIIPPEYNCRFNFACFIATDPKILHGKSQDYEETLKKIKATGRRMTSWKQGEVNYP